MNFTEFVDLVAENINKKAIGVVASVGKNGKLIIKSTVSGDKTGLNAFSIQDGATSFGETYFSSGQDRQQVVLIGNEGDTYFQRWDSIKTLAGDGCEENQVVDIASVMLESHINLDGRTDKYRGSMKIASLDWSQFGAINRAYCQTDDFLTSRELDDKYELDKYPSAITWTLPKSASADVDEWTHITLASTMFLDGDKGACRAIRRFRNSLYAFQDKGIAEILFNSSTPLSTESGIPVELANSGKVDGKRYLSSQYGAVNKWSIVEGKKALYFVDNINKAMCSIQADERGRISVSDMSTRLGFSAWFRKINSLVSWKPQVGNVGFDNLVGFYDKVYSDVYFVGKNRENSEPATLVYNENIGSFTSFFDYASVPMMTNVEDKFVAIKGNALYKMHEGKFNTFFGSTYPSEVTYRVTPEPYNDKIWTNIDYRGDFFKAFDDYNNYILPEGVSVNHLSEIASDLYQEGTSIDSIKVWNEYQETTSNVSPEFEKKFRIWRYQIPRALAASGQRESMDRIRNPWIYVRFSKTSVNALMNIHDVVVRYFE